MTVTDVVQLATDDADQTILYIAVGAGVGLGLVVVAACSVVLVVWLVRLVKRKQGLLTRIHTVVYMATLTALVCTHCSCVCMLTQEPVPPAVKILSEFVYIHL